MNLPLHHRGQRVIAEMRELIRTCTEGIREAEAWERTNDSAPPDVEGFYVARSLAHDVIRLVEAREPIPPGMFGRMSDALISSV